MKPSSACRWYADKGICSASSHSDANGKTSEVMYSRINSAKRRWESLKYGDGVPEYLQLQSTFPKSTST